MHLHVPYLANMVLFGLIILFLFLIGVRNPKAKPFGKEIVTVLKPFLAIGIVLHHLHAQSVVLFEFERWGPLIVGIFFFISGYGLSYAYKWRPNHMDHFVANKVVAKLIIPTVLAFCVNFVMNEDIDNYSFITHLTNPNGPSFFPNDWFMYSLIYCYLIFLVATKTSNRYLHISTLVCGILLLVIISCLNGFSRNWWATPCAFLIGALYFLNEDEFIRIVDGKHRFWESSVIYIFIFLCLIIFSALFKSNVTTVIAYSLLPLLLVNCMIRIDLTEISRNCIIQFLSRISFDIYLIHGIIISFLVSQFKMSGGILLISTLSLTLICAYMFYKMRVCVQRCFYTLSNINE